MKPLTIAGFLAAGLGLAYVAHSAMQPPGQKAGKGATVRVPINSLSIVTSGGYAPVQGFQSTDVASVTIASSDADTLYGSVRALANAQGAINVPASLASVQVALPRDAVLA